MKINIIFTALLLFTCSVAQAQTASGRALVSLLEAEADVCLQYKVYSGVLIASALLLTKDGTRTESHNYFRIIGEAYTNPKEALEHMCQIIQAVRRGRTSSTSDDIEYMAKAFDLSVKDILNTMYIYNLLYKRA